MVRHDAPDPEDRATDLAALIAALIAALFCVGIIVVFELYMNGYL